MGKHAIAVDVRNPGQVFACLGFLEVADVLHGGEAEGWFSWAEGDGDRFWLEVPGQADGFADVLAFLRAAKVVQRVPEGWKPPEKKPKKAAKGDDTQAEGDAKTDDAQALALVATVASDTTPARVLSDYALPSALYAGTQRVSVTHWADGSSREAFKLYAGTVAGSAKLHVLVAKYLPSLDADALRRDPLGLAIPQESAFNLDVRSGWEAIGAGYSPNDAKHALRASPVVEVLGAVGLEHARPRVLPQRLVRYRLWSTPAPPMLARAVLGDAAALGEGRRFQFRLAISGKTKRTTQATEVIG